MSTPPIDPKSFEQLETLIASAQHLVRTTSDLRPATLEQAKVTAGSMKLANRIVLGSTFIMLAWLAAIPILQFLTDRQHLIQGPTAEQIQQQAERYSESRHYSLDWGTADAYSELRHRQPSEASNDH